jgi:hypothetical protein
MGGACSMHGRDEEWMQNLVGKSKVKRPSSDSGQGLVAGSCEHGNEPSGSIKGVGNFLNSALFTS